MIMDVDISITLLTTIIAALLGALLNEYFSKKRSKKYAIYALIDELNENAELMSGYLKRWVHIGEIDDVFFPYIDAYIYARNLGVLVELKGDIRKDLMSIYTDLRIISGGSTAINLGLKKKVEPQKILNGWDHLIARMKDVSEKLEKEIKIRKDKSRATTSYNHQMTS